jgi:hypothetical protein
LLANDEDLTWWGQLRRSLGEQSVEQILTAEIKMHRHVGKDCRERTNPKRGMLGTREMLLAVLVGRKAEMAAGLASD